MENYTFDKQATQTIPICIDEHIYHANINLNTYRAILSVIDQFQPLFESVHNEMNAQEINQILLKVVQASEAFLDTVFEQGVYQQLFGYRMPNVKEHCDLLLLIFHQLKEAFT